MKELKFEELTLEQKIGLVMVASVRNKESFEFALELVKKRAIGAIWIFPECDYEPEMAMKAFREAADYPVIFIMDAENGRGEHKIGRHNSIGMTGSEELAYTFGKITAIEARKMGANIVCNPLLDMANGSFVCGTNIRSLGNNKETVARLAAAEARGMHDGGVLTVAKHYPGCCRNGLIDSHMAETTSDATVEELLDYNLYPYKYLMDRGLLDGVMTKHTRFTAIDDYYPASLSKKVTGIIRDMGFDGFLMTDALNMMGVVARFGKAQPKGLAIAGGNDIALPFGDCKSDYEAMMQCCRDGILCDEDLDRAVKNVLKVQHKVMLLPEPGTITEEDEENFRKINTDSIFAKTDDGVPTGLSKDGRHFFAILTDMDTENKEGRVELDTMTPGFYKPEKIIKTLTEKFPNSTCHAIREFPSANEVSRLLDVSLGYDDVVFITFFNGTCYIGHERFTPRIVSLMEAMQVTDRISTIVFFGNPYVLEELPHFSRVIIGSTSEMSVDVGLKVLAGEYPAKGVLTYDVKLK